MQPAASLSAVDITAVRVHKLLQDRYFAGSGQARSTISIYLYTTRVVVTVVLTGVNQLKLEVGRVGNFAGYRIRVPGRYYPAGSGYLI